MKSKLQFKTLEPWKWRLKDWKLCAQENKASTEPTSVDLLYYTKPHKTKNTQTNRSIIEGKRKEEVREPRNGIYWNWSYLNQIEVAEDQKHWCYCQTVEVSE